MEGGEAKIAILSAGLITAMLPSKSAMNIPTTLLQKTVISTTTLRLCLAMRLLLVKSTDVGARIVSSHIVLIIRIIPAQPSQGPSWAKI